MEETSDLSLLLSSINKKKRLSIKKDIKSNKSNKISKSSLKSYITSNIKSSIKKNKEEVISECEDYSDENKLEDDLSEDDDLLEEDLSEIEPELVKSKSSSKNKNNKKLLKSEGILSEFTHNTTELQQFEDDEEETILNKKGKVINWDELEEKIISFDYHNYHFKQVNVKPNSTNSALKIIELDNKIPEIDILQYSGVMELGSNNSANVSESTNSKESDKKSKKVKNLTLIDKPSSSIKELPNLPKVDKTLATYHIKPKLYMGWKETVGNLTELQAALAPYMFSYADMWFTNANYKNVQELRELYCLHALNIVYKSRDLILKNNRKNRENNYNLQYTPERDSGFNRPTVLIVAPYRNSAYQIYECIKKLLPNKKFKNESRFYDEFAPNEDDLPNPNKSEDFRAEFAGNIDDAFRVGISFQNNGNTLYAPFYACDIMIVSPLGLRLIVGAKGDSFRDYDFLSSISLSIIDSADSLTMQNWNHLVTLFQAVNEMPKSAEYADFARVHDYLLNEQGKLYRQNLVFSAYKNTDISSFLNKYCPNFAGCYRFTSFYTGSVSLVVKGELRQTFQRFNATSVASIADDRFNYFKKIFPTYVKPQLVVFIPSYFDFVRVRNFLKESEIMFETFCEYDDQSDISAAKDAFVKSKSRVLLVTERFHFYNRIKIRNIQHLLFYQLPDHPNFYSDWCNMMEGENTSMVLFNKYDQLQLERVVGTDRFQTLMKSEKNIHFFCTQ